MEKIRNKLAVIFAAVIVVFLAVSFILNISLMEAPFNSLTEEDATLSEFVKEVQDVYKADVEYKNSYININGLFARLTGRNTYNEVARLNNGMLTYISIPERDMDAYADGLIELDGFLADNGIEYVYVQCPNKSDINDTLLPVGVENYGNKNANILVDNLNRAGVDVIDLRPDIAGTVELVEKYFYNTDHHWNADASFYAYVKIVNMLKQKFPNAEFDESALLESSWERTVYEDWFLGSHGKRVGEYYAGVDDFIIYTPNFETNMSLYIPKHRKFYSGDFEKTLIREAYLDEPNYFEETPYCTYLGGDYPLVHHVNYNAKNDIKVLIFKDSFTLATQSFLSTQVREIDVIDPRYYTDSTLAEYVAASSPDIVITMINPSSFAARTYKDTGVAKAEQHVAEDTAKKLGTLKTIDVVAEDGKNYKNCILTDYMGDDGAYVLKPNTKYTLTIGGAELLKGKCDGFTVALFDHATQKVHLTYVFDFENVNEDGNYEWTFLTPELNSSRLKILVYAGLHGQTGGNTMRFTDLSITRWKAD